MCFPVTIRCGFGGKCFPKDLNAFIEFFNENEVVPHVLQSAWERNTSVRTNIDWASIDGAVSIKENE